MKKPLVQLTLRRWEEIYTDPRIYVLFFMFVIGFTIISPLGFDNDRTLYERFTFSVVGNAVCWPLALMITPPLRLFLQQRGLRIEIALLASCIISGLIITPLFLWVLENEFSTLPPSTRITELLLFMCFLFFVTSYGLMRHKYFPNPFEKASAQDTDITPQSVTPKAPPLPRCAGLQERMPASKRGIIWAMVAQDHYVEVITDKGSELILMRLSDAIDMCDSPECLRIHRSAWITVDGLKGIKKEGRNMIVELPTGRELPVARSAASKLKKFAETNRLNELQPERV